MRVRARQNRIGFGFNWFAAGVEQALRCGQITRQWHIFFAVPLCAHLRSCLTPLLLIAPA